MRRFQKMYVMVASVSAVLCAVGCELDGPSDYGAVLNPPEEVVEEPIDAVTASAQDYAARLAAAQQLGGIGTSPPVAEEVMWLRPDPGNPAPGNPGNPGSGSPGIAIPGLRETADPLVEVTPPPSQTIEAPLEPEVVMPAVFDISGASENSGGGSDFAKALNAVAVSLTDAHYDLDYRLLSPLPPRQQETVEKYHILLTALHQQLLSSPKGIDRQAFDVQLDEMFGQQPISIRQMILCRRVMGYGVYEPFDSTTFLAGREHKMIVYVELDHFRSMQRSGEQYSVDLQQEVTLYSSDGLAVWRNEAVKINDVSHNRRRDFFVVQLLKLPDRLGVGKYRLKIRVTDLNGSSIDEQGIDLNYVADRALVQDTPNPRDLLPLRSR